MDLKNHSTTIIKCIINRDIKKLVKLLKLYHGQSCAEDVINYRLHEKYEWNHITLAIVLANTDKKKADIYYKMADAMASFCYKYDDLERETFKCLDSIEIDYNGHIIRNKINLWKNNKFMHCWLKQTDKELDDIL